MLLLLVGVGVMSYPTLSDRWNSYHQTRAVAHYVDIIEQADQQSIDEQLTQAHAHNEQLPNDPNRFALTTEERTTYESLLNLTGDGLMGYLQIPCIGIELPIYHGTSEQVLQKAVGHLEGTSLPVGGEGTHAVLSGHCGLPTAKLFTDLNQLALGDRFTVTVLNQRLSYEVDQIRIVEPDNLEELQLIPGEDLMTLVTCTPYAVNSHRLLVRGRRVAEEANARRTRLKAAQTRLSLSVLDVVAALLLAVLALLLLWLRRCHRAPRRAARRHMARRRPR